MTFNRNPKLYPYRGKMLPASAIARMTGIHYDTIAYRGNNGFPVDVQRPTSRAPLYEFRGKMLPAKEIAAILGVSLTTVSARRIGNRIAEGEELKDPFREPHPHAILVHHKGETLTARAWAVRLGKKPSAIHKRIAKGVPPELAVALPVVPWATRRRNLRPFVRIINAFRRSRMVNGFRASMPRGYSPTFANAPGTGVGRHAHDLQPEKSA